MMMKHQSLLKASYARDIKIELCISIVQITQQYSAENVSRISTLRKSVSLLTYMKLRRWESFNLKICSLTRINLKSVRMGLINPVSCLKITDKLLRKRNLNSPRLRLRSIFRDHHTTLCLLIMLLLVQLVQVSLMDMQLFMGKQTRQLQIMHSIMVS